MTHKCTSFENNWCSDCDCGILCPNCKHKGLITIGVCSNDSTPADKLWCPNCDRRVYINIRTGNLYKNKEKVSIDSDMRPTKIAVRRDDDMIIPKPQ